MKKIAIIGYSGHALVVAECLQQNDYEIVGYFEKEEVKFNPLNIIHLGFERDSDFINKTKNIFIFPSIGDNYIRRKIMTLLIDNNLSIATAIHPRANISKYTEIKEGTIICQGACVNPFAKIGKGVIINTSSIVEHECVISDFVHIAPGAVLAGNVFVGDNSFIGANSVIKQGVTIGENVIIGAGSVVIQNILEKGIYVGSPAKKLKKY